MVSLNDSQVSAIGDLMNSGRYADGYRLVRQIVDEYRTDNPSPENLEPLNRLSVWLDAAASINSNDGSFSSEYVRGETEAASLFFRGVPLSEADFQRASDSLALSVLSDIINSRGVPGADDIIRKDVGIAVKELGLPAYGWAGTWGDILPSWAGGLGKDYVSLEKYVGDAYQ